MNAHATTFERYYQTTDDPWGFRTRWYERRKRALTKAILPRERYESAWEIGCSNGELAAALAPACERILATDGNARAVRAARERLAGVPGARVELLWVPEQIPEETFDLIVLSELAYYLDAPALGHLCRQLVTRLGPSGDFVACHWRPLIKGCHLTGNEAHAILHHALPWKSLARHVEEDFVLEVWSSDPRSVAETGGLR